jgi:hypothetical protein
MGWAIRVGDTRQQGSLEMTSCKRMLSKINNPIFHRRPDISVTCLSFATIGLYSKKGQILDWMIFESENRGKVIISIELNEGKLNSHIQRKGIARNDKYAIGSVLGTFISMCREAEKDPRKVLNDNLDQLEDIIDRQRDSSGKSLNPE